MALQTRSRSPHKASDKDIWCKVKDGKRLVKVDAAGTDVQTLSDVNDVVRVVKFIVKPKLDNVPTDELVLYRTEDAKNRSDEQLPSNMPISELVQQSLGLYGEPVFLDYDAATATSSQANEMFHLAATLRGWGNVFGARRALFTLAAECAAYGQIGECIKHIPVLGQTDSIGLDLWFRSEESRARLIGAVYRHPSATDESIQLTLKKLKPPESIEAILPNHYERDDGSPEQHASTGAGSTAPAATQAAQLRAKLHLQRLDKVEDKIYQNMHIIPAALLDDGRKLVCEWLFLSASPVFHVYFDGTDTAPHIQVRIMERSSSCDGLVNFTVEVNTGMVGADTFISKPANSFDLQKPDIGYQTFVKVPEAQADHFERAVKWRCACVEAAWARKSQGHPVSITGDHVWWQLLELPAELQVAVGEAKKAAGLGAEVDTGIAAAVD